MVMSRKIDVVVVGELNIDLVLWEVPFPENEQEKLAKDMRFAMGSSSAITAHNLSVIGGKVGFIGKSGKDTFGDFMIEGLKGGGVDTSAIICDKNLKTGATIVIANPPNKALLTYMGAMADLTIEDINWEFVAQAKHMHVGCFFLQTGIRHDVDKLFAKAKSLGLTTSLDTNWDPDDQWGEDLHRALQYTDIFLPNDDEAKRIAGTDDLDKAIKILNGKVKILAVKRGNHGATVCVDGKSFTHPGYRTNAVETTGAGDSFNAGFLYKYLQSAIWEDCLKWGNGCGALAVTALGGTGAFQNKDVVMTNLSKLMG